MISDLFKPSPFIIYLELCVWNITKCHHKVITIKCADILIFEKKFTLAKISIVSQQNVLQWTADCKLFLTQQDKTHEQHEIYADSYHCYNDRIWQHIMNYTLVILYNV